MGNQDLVHAGDVQAGIFTIGTQTLSYAHSDADIEALLARYREVFGLIGEAVSQGTLKERLECEPLVPLFKVR